MKRIVGLIALVAAAQASATTYKASLTGTLTQQTKAGADPSVYHIGSTVTLTATFSDKDTVVTPFGYTLAGLYPLTAASTSTFLLASEGGNWRAGDEQYDGLEVYTRFNDIQNADGTFSSSNYSLAYPALGFAHGKVVALAGKMVPSGDTPVLTTGQIATGQTFCQNVTAGGEVTCRSTWSEGRLSNRFSIVGGTYLYANRYDGPSFTGIWDYAGSSVTAVPEPASWLLMIAGFGLIGSAMRRRVVVAG